MLTELEKGDAIFARAIEIASAEKRDAYLTEACGGNAALKRQVEERVHAHFQSSGAASGPAETAPSRREWEQTSGHQAHGITEGPGTRIGPYRLLKQIEEDAAAVVFQAEQQEPVHRPVTLLLFKSNTEQRDVAARLEAERSALLSLSHPNLARVLDTGTTQRGRPYLVMEPIKGDVLTTYCENQKLTVLQRLELFITVCQAVQEAHYKGIVHGNLQPSNVRVVNHNGKPLTKVVGLGLAAVTRQKLAEFVQSGEAPGSMAQLPYVSPELAESNATALDTRGDVYSLGVLLYELLTGTTPVPPERLKEVAKPEGLRLIREEKAPQPSTRVSEWKERLAPLAGQRRVEMSEWIRSLRGELDSVVMKALQKDRRLRYDTPHEFAQDLQHYLADEPVQAYRNSGLYRIRKEARKYPRSLAAACLLVLLLASAGVVGAGLFVRANQTETRAQALVHQAEEERVHAQKHAEEALAQRKQLEAQKEAADHERDDALAAELAARRSAEAGTLALTFFNDKVLSAGRPLGWVGGNWASTYGKTLTLLQAVDKAEAKVPEAFAHQPFAEALIRETLGSSYLDLGEAAQAVKQYERALALREALLGPDNPATISCRDRLAVAYRQANRPNDASRLFDDNPDTPSHAEALAIRAAILLGEKKPSEAESKLRECLAIREKIQPNEWTTFDTKSLLGEALLEQKKYAEAEPLLMSGYEGLKEREDKIPSLDKARLTKALERLVRLHEKWGKEKKAAQWRKELDLAKAAGNL